MQISEKDWNNYIKLLSQLNETAGSSMIDFILDHGTEDKQSVIDFAFGLVTKYGEGSAALAAEMYDVIAKLSGKDLPAAEVAETASHDEVAKAIYGTQKHSLNPKSYGSTVSRLVKQAGADTTLKNAVRDGAQFAWVPSGDTCAFCITLASRGFQYVSKKTLRNGHAEHIHANCNCNYTVRFDNHSGVAGYDPDKYLEMYRSADGKTPNDKINALRRMQYQDPDTRERINAQKREAYRLQKENNSLIEDVTNSYKGKSTPGEGNIVFDKGYTQDNHKEEITFAKWIHDVLGGNIRLLSESTIDGQKMPDFIWNDTNLELKSVSSIASIDRQIHKAVKQIGDNGIIAIDISGHTENIEKTIQEIEYRLPKRARGNTDLIIKQGDELIKIIRSK